MSWRSHDLDGAVLHFDRATGTNVLVRSQETDFRWRLAPRVLQVALHSRCNFDCSFCYRDARAKNLLTADFLTSFLKDAAVWGVLEVAFGGGEPLMFPGFVPLVERLHRETPLAISFTTNGSLLHQIDLRRLKTATAEIRVSVYEGTDYRAILRLLRGWQVGVNWLVTPANVAVVEPFVVDVLSYGARNVLLLGYMGADRNLHLEADQLSMLKRAARRLEGLPVRLHVCWYPDLEDVPHLFARPDCGAGDDFLTITPDRCVQPCSFHHEKRPFDTLDQVASYYRELRGRRSAASIGGCRRSLFPGGDSPLRRDTTYVWRAFAGNNSGDWTIVGRFRSADDARRAAEALRELARAHEAFLASPEGQRWLEQNDYMGDTPTPPLVEFGEAHGFGWNEEGQGLWWEEDGAGAPVLTAGAVGNAVVVYHEYCMGLPEDPFRNFFRRVGATEFGAWQYDRPRVVVRARGRNDVAERTLLSYLETVNAAEYASDVETDPPWGGVCADPRVAEDESRVSRLSVGPHELHRESDGIRLVAAFENTFAGPLGLAAWLEGAGYRDVHAEVESALQPLDAPEGRPAMAPCTGLFPVVRPLRERIADMSSEELLVEALGHTEPPEQLLDAVHEIPPERRAILGFKLWREHFQRDRMVVRSAAMVMKGLGGLAADWARDVWAVATRGDEDRVWGGMAAIANGLPEDEAFELAREWYGRATKAPFRRIRLDQLRALANPRTATLIEEYWASPEENEPVIQSWGELAAASRIGWPTALKWLRSGRPLSIIALDMLRRYGGSGTPDNWEAPLASEIEEALQRHLEVDDAPRASAALRAVRDGIDRLASDGKGTR